MPTIGTFNFCSFHVLPDNFSEISADTLLLNNVNSADVGNSWIASAIPSQSTNDTINTSVNYAIDSSPYDLYEIDTLPFSSSSYVLNVDNVVSSTITTGNLETVGILSTNISNSNAITTDSIKIIGRRFSIGLSDLGQPQYALLTDGTGYVYWSSIPDLMVNTINVWRAAQSNAYVYAYPSVGVVDIYLEQGNNFSFQMNQNATLAAPHNPTAGQSGTIMIKNGTSTTYTLGFNSFWKFAGGVVPTLTATTNAVDVLHFTVDPTGTYAACWILKNVK